MSHVTFELLKAPISNIDDTGFTINLGAQYGSPTTIRVMVRTAMFDLREGDLLTIHTSVLLAQPKGTG